MQEESKSKYYWDVMYYYQRNSSPLWVVGGREKLINKNQDFLCLWIDNALYNVINCDFYLYTSLYLHPVMNGNIPCGASSGIKLAL